MNLCRFNGDHPTQIHSFYYFTVKLYIWKAAAHICCRHPSASLPPCVISASLFALMTLEDDEMPHSGVSGSHTAPSGELQLSCTSMQIIYSSYEFNKDPQHHPTSASSDTCRCLSPTTGPLPTVHCWQSTMHCPNSAKWGKGLFDVYMYTGDLGERGGI